MFLGVIQAYIFKLLSNTRTPPYNSAYLYITYNLPEYSNS